MGSAARCATRRSRVIPSVQALLIRQPEEARVRPAAGTARCRCRPSLIVSGRVPDRQSSSGAHAPAGGGVTGAGLTSRYWTRGGVVSASVMAACKLPRSQRIVHRPRTAFSTASKPGAGVTIHISGAGRRARRGGDPSAGRETDSPPRRGPPADRPSASPAATQRRARPRARPRAAASAAAGRPFRQPLERAPDDTAPGRVRQVAECDDADAGIPAATGMIDPNPRQPSGRRCGGTCRSGGSEPEPIAAGGQLQRAARGVACRRAVQLATAPASHGATHGGSVRPPVRPAAATPRGTQPVTAEIVD